MTIGVMTIGVWVRVG